MTRIAQHRARPAAITAAVLFAACTVFCGIAFGQSRQTTDEVRSLFVATSADVPARTELRPDVVQSRFVRIDRERLPSFADPSPAFELDLFPGVRVVFRADRRVRHAADRVSWFGSVGRNGDGRAILVRSGDVLAGRVSLPGAGTFRFRYAGGDQYRIEQTDDSRLVDICGTKTAELDSDTNVAPSAGTVADHEGCDHDDGTVVDLLAVYTGAAAAAAGGSSAIEAIIQMHVDVVNEIYAASGVAHRLRLVHAESVVYDEDGLLSDHRQRLTDPGDGIMDGVHDVRDEYGADLVSLYYDQHSQKICVGGATPEEACTDDADCDKLCKGGSDDGDACNDDGDCGKLCIGGANDGLACVDNGDCPSDDGTCVSNVCDGGANDGEACNDDGDCEGNNGTCDGKCDGFCALEFTGLAWQLTSGQFSHGFEAKAFHCVKWNSVDWLLAHESAHNQGCGHDHDNVQSGGLYSYSWGQRFTGDSDGKCKGGDNHGDTCDANGDCPDGVCKRGVCNANGAAGADCADDSDCPKLCLDGDNHGGACNNDGDCPNNGTCRGICTRWRTVMAYSPGTVCDLFSNPGVAYDGDATGTTIGNPGEAHNAKTLNDANDIVANFRGNNFWVDYAYPGLPEDPENGCPAEPFNTLTEGLTATPKRGTLHIQSTTINGPWNLTKPMRIEAEGGSVVIGQ